MGRGCAAQAKKRWPGIEFILGSKIQCFDNHSHILTRFSPLCLFLPVGDPDDFEFNTIELDFHVVSFPVKHHWRDEADLDLIKKSAIQLMNHVDGLGWGKVILPRPGCGNGRLTWEKVKPILESVLDDRVLVISPSRHAIDRRRRKTKSD